MDHQSKNGEDTAFNSNSGTAPECSATMLAAWHPPRLITIDIKRTMFALGSVLDGFSGSL